MRPHDSLPPAYFEGMFRDNDDPWQFASSAYEAEKYCATLDALDDRVYAAGFEVGCANGVLTRQFARVCESLLAIDVSTSALVLARQRCADLRNVSFEEKRFPGQTPDDPFDLIVMSEVVYYWSREDIRRSADFVRNHLAANGDLLLVHWIGETDYPHSGDEAVNLLRDHLPQLAKIKAKRTDRYRLDLWRRS